MEQPSQESILKQVMDSYIEMAFVHRTALVIGSPERLKSELDLKAKVFNLINNQNLNGVLHGV